VTEVAWFAALCDDDYEFLGVADPALQSSWDHCRDIVLRAEANGFDNVLLPSGYALGMDATAFAAAIAVETSRIKLLLAVRLGELVVPQLARQIATLQQIAGGRLVINAISSDVPGETLSSEARYQRTTESLAVLRTLLRGERADVDGEYVTAHVDAPRIAVDHPHDPVVYFGGLSEAARQCAAESCDVYLMWPDTTERMRAVMREMNDRAAAFGRTLRYGWRSHVIVRDTEAQARAAATRLLSRLDVQDGAAIRAKSLDSQSAGVARQSELRESADDDGYLEPHLWTGVGRARSGAGIAIVGDPDQVSGKLLELRNAGIDTFILSGYPHLAECDLVARHVLPKLRSAKVAERLP
jgi:alkanesulfonate monooxygenase